MGPMERARTIVESHVTDGVVSDTRSLIDAIAIDLGFVQLASIPHRDGVADRDAQIAALTERVRASQYALQKIIDLQDRSFLTHQELIIRAFTIAREGLKAAAGGES